MPSATGRSLARMSRLPITSRHSNTAAKGGRFAMNWAKGLSWWSALRARGAEQSVAEHDHGDMGTAFGLDASLGPIDESPAMASGALPAPSPLPWEHRLTRRSSL